MLSLRWTASTPFRKGFSAHTIVCQNITSKMPKRFRRTSFMLFTYLYFSNPPPCNPRHNGNYTMAFLLNHYCLWYSVSVRFYISNDTHRFPDMELAIFKDTFLCKTHRTTSETLPISNNRRHVPMYLQMTQSIEFKWTFQFCIKMRDAAMVNHQKKNSGATNGKLGEE